MKKIWITGTTSGVGEALMLNLPTNKKELVIEINKDKFDFSLLQYKGNEKSLVSMLNGFKDMHGLPEVLVLNAGVMHNDFVEDYPIEKWDEIINVNLKANFVISKWMVQEQKKYMARYERDKVGLPIKRRVVFNISMAYKYALRCSVAYCCSKAAMNMMLKCLAKEVSGRVPGIFFYGLSPGGIEHTQMVDTAEKFLVSHRGMTADEAYHYQRQSPLKRNCSKGEVVNTLMYLMFDAPEFMTGSNIEFTGGFPC